MRSPRDFSRLLGGRLLGLSDALLADHLALYRDYVERLNALDDRHDHFGGHRMESGFLVALRSREGYLLNAVWLHEVYFEQLASPDERSLRAVGEKWALPGWPSAEDFRRDLWAAGLASTGWVLTVLAPGDERVRNVLVGEHHVGVPAGAKVLLAMDCWEHAYAHDYGIRKPDYLQAFQSNLDWGVVERRLVGPT